MLHHAFWYDPADTLAQTHGCTYFPTHHENVLGLHLVYATTPNIFIALGDYTRPGFYCVLGQSVTYTTYRHLAATLDVRTYIVFEPTLASGIYIVYTFDDQPTTPTSP
jgi:hypothetical protein